MVRLVKHQASGSSGKRVWFQEGWSWPWILAPTLTTFLTWSGYPTSLNSWRSHVPSVCLTASNNPSLSFCGGNWDVWGEDLNYVSAPCLPNLHPLIVILGVSGSGRTLEDQRPPITCVCPSHNFQRILASQKRASTQAVSRDFGTKPPGRSLMPPLPSCVAMGNCLCSLWLSFLIC